MHRLLIAGSPRSDDLQLIVNAPEDLKARP